MPRPVLSSSRNGFAALLITALLALAVFAGAAQACSYSGAKTVFSPWGDQHNYVLAPDGGFEAGGSGWQLSRGATAVGGNESYYLKDAGGPNSLSPPAPPPARPAARNSGTPSSQWRGEASYKLLGLVRTKTAGTIRAGSTWAPT